MYLEENCFDKIETKINLSLLKRKLKSILTKKELNEFNEICDRIRFNDSVTISEDLKKKIKHNEIIKEFIMFY